MKAMARFFRKGINNLSMYVIVGIPALIIVAAYIAATGAIGYLIGICILHAPNETCVELGILTFAGITALILLSNLILKKIRQW